MKNKGFAVLISCMMMLTAMPLQSVSELQTYATDTETEDTSTFWYRGQLYENRGDHIALIGSSEYFSGKYEGAIIPRELEDLPVTEIEEGAFCGSKIRQIIWPEWITTVPANCFQNSPALTLVVFPDTLECIETGEFDGCNKMRDVMYMGDDAEWDAISVGSSNERLRNAHILTNFNKPNGRDVRFVDGVDNWSFTNNEMGQYLHSNDTITEYMEGCHPDSLDWQISIHEAGFNSDTYYKGACAGFALTTYLVCLGILEPSDIYEGAETLHDIPLCDEAIKAITFYFHQSYKEPFVSAEDGEDSDAEYIESGRFFADMEKGNAVVLSYMVKQGGHSVIAYGIEHGEWQYGDMIYTKRLLTYDNNALGFTDKACIYFNGDFEGMYIPYLDSEAGISDLFYDPNLIPYGIGNKTIYQSTFKAGDLDKDESVNAVDAAEILTAAASVGSGSDSGLNNGQQYAADVNADGELNALDAALVLQYAAYVGAGGTLTFEEFLKTA